MQLMPTIAHDELESYFFTPWRKSMQDKIIIRVQISQSCLIPEIIPSFQPFSSFCWSFGKLIQPECPLLFRATYLPYNSFNALLETVLFPTIFKNIILEKIKLQYLVYKNFITQMRKWIFERKYHLPKMLEALQPQSLTKGHSWSKSRLGFTRG